MYNVALSTSLSWDRGWDPNYSINLTKEYNISNIQIFVGDNFLNNSSLCTNVAKSCNNELNLIAHSPVDLDENALDPELIRDLVTVLKFNRKLVVYHHNYMYPVDKTLKVVRELNKKGITVLLENFYTETSNCEVIRNIKSFKDILLKSRELDLDIFPLLDIPRLFNNKIDSDIDPLKETLSLLEYIEGLKLSLYLHLIDCSNSSQSRDSWCPVGSGVIPYKEVFSKISNLEIDIPLVVLEFEDIEHVDESINFLKEM